MNFYPPPRARSALRVGGWLLLAVFIVAVAGAVPRYSQVVFGAPPLALALLSFAIADSLPDRRGGHRPRRIVWLMLAVAVAAIWIRPELAGGSEESRRAATKMRQHVLLTLPQDRYRAELFDELQPVEVPDCQIVRLGSPGDGGYLMCANLLGPVKAGYSYGIGAAGDAWGCDVARRLNVPVHQYDCFDPTPPACSGGAGVFHNECIGPARRTDASGRIFDTLENQLARNGDGAHLVVMKMDVEGAEWDSLLQTSSAVLERIDQLAIELHGVGEEKQVAVVRKLKQHFHVVNVHFNNWACGPGLDPFPASVYEVLLVNKRIAKAGGPRPRGPLPLDAPTRSRGPDCQAQTSRWSLGGR